MCVCVYIQLTISRLFVEQTWGPATCLGTHFELDCERVRALVLIVLRHSRGHMSVSLYSKGFNKAQDVVATYSQSNVRTISIANYRSYIASATASSCRLVTTDSLANPKSNFSLAKARYFSLTFNIERSYTFESVEQQTVIHVKLSIISSPSSLSFEVEIDSRIVQKFRASISSTDKAGTPCIICI